MGWIRINFGGTGGPVTYLGAAYNDTPGEGIHVPEPSSVALAALASLALGARGLRRLREKRKAQ